MNRWKETEDSIVRSIMSGNNACGTLRTATENGKLEPFLRMAIQAGLRPRAEEAAQAAEDIRQAGILANIQRPALERIFSVCDSIEPAEVREIVKAALRQGLPGVMV